MSAVQHVAACVTEPQGPVAIRIRVVCRDSRGEIHFDWPVDKIQEAVDDAGATVWVDIEDPTVGGHEQAESLLRKLFKFHPLAVEDALKECHVPKVDDWGDYIYLVFHTIDFCPKTDHLRVHELDIFV